VTENIACVTKAELALYEMFKPQEKGRKVKVERGEEGKKRRREYRVREVERGRKVRCVYVWKGRAENGSSPE
jgi:hypothetical protein